MKYHPIACIFPLLEDDDLQSLADDIRQHGLREDIILFEDKILDGRNRQAACLLAGAKPRYKQFSGTFNEACDFVWSTNVHRRHLQSGQAAACWKKREKLETEIAATVEAIKADAKERKKRKPADVFTCDCGEQFDAECWHCPSCGYHWPIDRQDCHNCYANRPTSVRQRFVEQNPTELRSDHHRAKLAGTNRQYINDADTLDAKAPDLLEEVAVGKKTLPQAKRELKDRERAAKRQVASEQIAAAPTIEQALGAAKFTTICIDPPWDWGDEGDNSQLGRGKTVYGELSIQELHDLPIADYADGDAHIYLWITNRSLPKGFALLESWGFRYVTCITWCKPSFGMGNYFRGSTEQILFGVRGSLPLSRKDAGTWFEAKRGPDGHSSKPVEFYDLVESCSPGPYLDVFSRREREGWISWGGQLNA